MSAWMIVILCLAGDNANPSSQICRMPVNYDIVTIQRFENREKCEWYLKAIQPWPGLGAGEAHCSSNNQIFR